MIIGIGIDIVETARMNSWLDQPGILELYFHPLECEQIMKRGKFRSSALATRFAAKEAFVKALGSGFRDLKLRDICTVTEPSGKPRLLLEGKAKTAFEKKQGKSIHLSLSREKTMAIAQVIIEG